jgi:hypothetical protein
MPREDGQFKAGVCGNPNGRPKGSKTRERFDVAAILKAHNCNPVEILMLIAKGDMETLELTHDQKKYFSVRLRMEAAAELLQYVAPKLKSVELTSDSEAPVLFNINYPAKE